MKKTNFLFTLFLCLTLLVSFASAETAAYVPGETTSALFADAFDAGLMVGGEAQLTLKANPAMFDDDADLSQIDALTDVLNDVRLTGGLGKIEDGYRLELVGSYAPENCTPVDVNLALNMTIDGISIESNLLKGERVTAKWETLLALCGADDTMIAQFSALKEMDWDTALSELAETVGAYASLAATLAEPYLNTFGEFIASLNINVTDDVAANGDLPAVDHELTIECSMADIARLMDALADQLEKDDDIAPYLEALLSSSFVDFTFYVGDEVVPVSTVPELCDFLRGSANQLAQTDLTIYYWIGYCDDDTMPLYVICQMENDVCQFILTPDETGNGTDCYVYFGTLDDAGNDLEYIAFETVFAQDPEDKSVCDLSLDFFGESVETGLGFSFTYALSSTKSPNADAYQFVINTDFIGHDASNTEFRYTQSGNCVQSLTPTGGEQATYSMVTSSLGDSNDLTINLSVSSVIEPADPGVVGHYQYNMTEDGPDALWSLMDIDIDVFSWAYDPASTAALTETALETATNDEMDALVTRLSTAAQQKLAGVLAILPPEVMQIIMSSEE